MQGGEHATLLPESNLRLAVHSSRPLYGAGPCERKEGLDTFVFFLANRTSTQKVFESSFNSRAAKRKSRPTQANSPVSRVKNQSDSESVEVNLCFDNHVQVRGERTVRARE